MTDRRAMAVAAGVLLVLLVDLVVVLVGLGGGPLDERDAAACGQRVAAALGYDVDRPTVAADTRADLRGQPEEVWQVAGVASNTLLRVAIRAVDGRVLDVSAIPAGGPGGDVLDREQRLRAFEVDCGS